MPGFSNPIVGGAETLIRSAIKSVNYVLGIAGWRITRTGSAEFNDATIRGSISAGNGTVLLNAGGLNIHSIATGKQFDININAGFLARLFPDDGQSLAQVLSDPAIGGLILVNTTPSSVVGITFENAQFSVEKIDTITDSTPITRISGAFITGFGFPSILMSGGNTTNGNLTDIELQANNTHTFGDFVVEGSFSRPGVALTLPVGGGGMANNTVTVITPTAALTNSYAMWVPGNNFFTILRAGLWEIGGALRYATNATGDRQFRFNVNGAAYYQWDLPALTGFNTEVGGTIQLNLAFGDQIQYAGFQNSGGGLQIVGNSMGWARLMEG